MNRNVVNIKVLDMLPIYTVSISVLITHLDCLLPVTPRVNYLVEYICVYTSCIGGIYNTYTPLCVGGKFIC